MKKILLLLFFAVTPLLCTQAQNDNNCDNDQDREALLSELKSAEDKLAAEEKSVQEQKDALKPAHDAKVKAINDEIDAANKAIKECLKDPTEYSTCSKPHLETLTIKHEELATENKSYNDKLENIENSSKKKEYQQEVSRLEGALAGCNLDLLSKMTSKFSIKDKLSVGKEAELTIVDPEEGKNTNILNRIIKIFAQVLGTFGVLMLVIGGILMITSEGDENRLQKGKNIFFYTVVGLLVAFASFMAVQFIISILFTAA